LLGSEPDRPDFDLVGQPGQPAHRRLPAIGAFGLEFHDLERRLDVDFLLGRVAAKRPRFGAVFLGLVLVDRRDVPDEPPGFGLVGERVFHRPEPEPDAFVSLARLVPFDLQRRREVDRLGLPVGRHILAVKMQFGLALVGQKPCAAHGEFLSDSVFVVLQGLQFRSRPLDLGLDRLPAPGGDERHHQAREDRPEAATHAMARMNQGLSVSHGLLGVVRNEGG